MHHLACFHRSLRSSHHLTRTTASPQSMDDQQLWIEAEFFVPSSDASSALPMASPPEGADEALIQQLHAIKNQFSDIHPATFSAARKIANPCESLGVGPCNFVCRSAMKLLNIDFALGGFVERTRRRSQMTIAAAIASGQSFASRRGVQDTRAPALTLSSFM